MLIIVSRFSCEAAGVFTLSPRHLENRHFTNNFHHKRKKVFIHICIAIIAIKIE